MLPPNRAIRIAAALALTVAGGVSALFLTIGPIGSSSAETITDSGTQSGASTETVGAIGTDGDPTVIVEYVDQFGNPIDPNRISSGTAGSTPAAATAQSGTATVQPRSYDDHDEHDDDHEGYERDHDDDHHEYEYEGDDD